MNLLSKSGTLLAATLAAVFTLNASAAESGPLQAGAAKVDITPDENAIPRPFTSILDHLYARAIFLDNGHDRAVLLNGDLGLFSTDSWNRVSTEIHNQMNVPIANILISATHDHNAIFGGTPGPDGKPEARTAAFQEKMEAGMLEAVKQAKAKLQPAKIGYGTGMLYLNVNRDEIDEKTRLWAQEPNLDYPSDKTLAVIKIESMSGDLIAVYMNYAMHAISLFLDGKVSGDFPGEAERYIEHLYGDKVVALWTSGAAGDQNPLYVRANGIIANARIQALREAEHVDEGTGVMRAMMVGDPASDKIALDPIALEESIRLVKSEGQITAEAAIQVMSHMRVMQSDVQIEGAQDEVTCPARKRLDTGREGAPGKYEDSPDPVRLRIGALRIGDIALGSADAELYNMIGQRVKQGSKLSDTIMLTLTNGMANSGYVPTDDAFGRYTFQVLSSRLKPGCAEARIENGIDGMIQKLN
jgi:hypothetical protein